MLANLLHQTSLCLFQWFIQSFTLFSAQMNWRNISSITQDLHQEKYQCEGTNFKLEAFKRWGWPMRWPDTTHGNSQWPALQLAWSAKWIERCIRSSQTSGFNLRSSLKIFSFFFNQVSCSIYCEDHAHFHLFIHISKYDSFH